MCIVIDINSLPKVFDETNNDHQEFLPVKEWILRGEGVIVIGGSSFLKELEEMPRYLRLITRFKDAGKTVKICDTTVDEREQVVKDLTRNTDCDDPHLIALLGVSRCDLFCSVDKRSYKFIKEPKLYPKQSRRVKIYTGSRNVNLLVKKNVSDLSNVV